MGFETLDIDKTDYDITQKSPRKVSRSTGGVDGQSASRGLSGRGGLNSIHIYNKRDPAGKDEKLGVKNSESKTLEKTVRQATQ